MATYVLPFVEVQRGWYEIEADSIEQARQLANDVDYISDLEPNYKDGQTDWDPDEVQPIESVTYIRQES